MNPLRLTLSVPPLVNNASIIRGFQIVAIGFALVELRHYPVAIGLTVISQPVFLAILVVNDVGKLTVRIKALVKPVTLASTVVHFLGCTVALYRQPQAFLFSILIVAFFSRTTSILMYKPTMQHIILVVFAHHSGPFPVQKQALQSFLIFLSPRDHLAALVVFFL